MMAAVTALLDAFNDDRAVAGHGPSIPLKLPSKDGWHGLFAVLWLA
jgi:hypothetical protein